MGVSVTYHAMTMPGMRNSGPPYSQAQLPGVSWRREKKDRAFRTAARGVLASGREVKPYHTGQLDIHSNFQATVGRRERETP